MNLVKIFLKTEIVKNKLRRTCIRDFAEQQSVCKDILMVVNGIKYIEMLSPPHGNYYLPKYLSSIPRNDFILCEQLWLFNTFSTKSL